MNKVLNTFNKFLFSDIQKVCGAEVRPSLNLGLNLNYFKLNNNSADHFLNTSFTTIEKNDSYDNLDINLSFNLVSENNDFGKSTSRNSSANTTKSFTVDSISSFGSIGNNSNLNNNNSGSNSQSMSSMNEKNIYEEMSSFTFQAQYFVEQ